VADRRRIAQHVWDNEAGPLGSNTIDVHLARLRGKISGATARIETIRGIGYRIIPAISERDNSGKSRWSASRRF
jgi:DNA-binding response OmpR family regulator